jgi:hypothetical protein
MASPFVSYPSAFGSRQLSAWLLVKGNQIDRMYIALPTFERVFYRSELAAIQKYEHGISVAAALTTKGARSTATIVQQRALANARRGVTAIKMANTIHDWLSDVPLLKRKDRYPLHSSKQLL